MAEIWERQAARAFPWRSQLGWFDILAAIRDGLPWTTPLSPSPSCWAALPLRCWGLVLVMTEEGLSPTLSRQRITWGEMLKTVGDAGALLHRRVSPQRA